MDNHDHGTEHSLPNNVMSVHRSLILFISFFYFYCSIILTCENILLLPHCVGPVTTTSTEYSSTLYYSESKSVSLTTYCNSCKNTAVRCRFELIWICDVYRRREATTWLWSWGPFCLFWQGWGLCLYSSWVSTHYLYTIACIIRTNSLGEHLTDVIAGKRWERVAMVLQM